jgi:hypothetical protein
MRDIEKNHEKLREDGPMKSRAPSSRGKRSTDRKREGERREKRISALTPEQQATVQANDKRFVRSDRSSEFSGDKPSRSGFGSQIKIRPVGAGGASRSSDRPNRFSEKRPMRIKPRGRD